MKSVWKFPIVFDGTAPVTVRMPIEAKIVHVALTNGNPTLWAEITVGDDREEDRRFVINGTGWVFPDENVYLGTVFEGPFVWHIYEVLA